MLEQLPNFVTSWHLVYVTFLVTFFGEVGLPLPGVMVSVHLFTGYQMASGNFLLAALVLAFNLAGAVTGSLVMYTFARKFGAPFMRRLWRHMRLKEEWLATAERRLTHIGPLSVAQVRLVPGLAVPASIVAGAGRAPLLAFAVGVMISEIIWRVPLLAIGYVAGVSAVDLSAVAGWAPVAIGGVALLLILVRVAWLLAPHAAAAWARRSGAAVRHSSADG